MVVQTLAFAAAAAALTPFTLAQTADAPVAVPSMAKVCKTNLGGNNTHSLLDILEGQFATANLQDEDSVLAPLLEEASDETMALLMDFDATAEGYTLLMPLNTDKDGMLLSDTYNLTTPTVLAAADEILRAHILPGTIDYLTLKAETKSSGMYIVESLQGFEWTFEWKGKGDGYAYIVDEWNVTTTGELEIQSDIKNAPGCPNTIIAIKGFVVTPDLLTPAPVPAPAISPRGVEAPTTPGAPVAPPTAGTTTPTPPSEEAASTAAAGGLTASGLAALSAVGAAALGAALL